MSTIKYVTEESLSAVLVKLKEWMPFKKKDGEVHIEGDVYIENNGEEVKLQDFINNVLEPHEAIENNEIDNIIEQFN